MNYDEMMDMIEKKYGYFYQTTPIEDIRGTLHWSTFDFLYNLYDELMEAHPNRITRQTLGYGYNLEGEVDETYPIYEYTIKPIQTTQLQQDGVDSTLLDTPVILLLSGVHGGEKAASYGLYQVMKQMLENPHGHQRVHRLQSTYTFKVLPIATPGGYNRPHRENPRGININRNFGIGKIEGEPYSEIETQVICQWMEDNQGSFAFIDCHNFVRTFLPDRQPVMSSYHLSPNPRVNQMYSEFIRKISPVWKDTYLAKYADLGDIAYGFIPMGTYNFSPTTVSEAYYRFGYQLSSTIESSNQDPDDLDKFNTVKVLEMTVDIYMNYLLELTEKFGS